MANFSDKTFDCAFVTNNKFNGNRNTLKTINERGWLMKKQKKSHILRESGIYLKILRIPKIIRYSYIKERGKPLNQY